MFRLGESTMGLLSAARSLIEAPQFENRAGYRVATAWYEGLDHSAHADASEEKLAHARWTYEMAAAAVTLNNEKAYKLLQFAAILAGGLVAGLKLGEHLIQRWWLAVPSMNPRSSRIVTISCRSMPPLYRTPDSSHRGSSQD
jgi:hypothetical protein